MSKKLVFDTLNYAKMLEKGGVEHADIHAASLAEATAQNLYTKDEVEKMVEAALSRFDARTHELGERFSERTNAMDKRFAERTNRFEIEMKEQENRFEKAANRSLYATVTILGALIVIVGALATFAHSFMH